VNANQVDISIEGNFKNTGSFLGANPSLTISNGSKPSTIYGNNTFLDFTAIATGKRIYFEAGKTQTILGDWTLQGGYAKHVRLLSTETDKTWYVDSQGARNITYTWVEDSHNLNASKIIMTESTNRDGSYNWDPTATWTNAGSDGLWSNADNWDGLGGGVTPGAGDDVVFNGTSTDNSTMDAGFSILSFSATSGYTGTITLAGALDIGGSFSIAAGTFDAAGYAMSVGGSWTNTGGTFTANSNTVTFNAGGIVNIVSGGGSFHHVTFNNGSGDWTLSDAFSATGDFTLTAGDFYANAKAMSVGGAWLNDGGVFNHDNNTVTLVDPSTNYWLTSRGSHFYNLVIDGGGNTGWTQLDALVVDNDLTISDGVLNPNRSALSVTGNFDNQGILYLYGDEDLSGLTRDTNSGFVQYVGVNTLNYGNTYYDLHFTDGNYTLSSAITVNHDLIIRNDASLALAGYSPSITGSVSNNGTIKLQGVETIAVDTDSGTMEYNGSGTYGSLSAGNNYYNLKISGSGSFTANSALDINSIFSQTAGTFVAPSSTLNIAGNFTKSGGTFTHNSGTVIFDGTTSLTSGGAAFNNVTIGTNTTSGSVTLADTTDVNGALTFNTTGGTATLNSTNRTVNYAGATLNLTNADTFTTTGSTWIFDGTTSLTSAGKIFNNMTIGTNSASGSLTLADTADINGTLSFNTTGGTAVLDSTNRTVNYAGSTLSLTNADTFTTTGSTWIFDGTTSLTSAGKTFNNMTIGTNSASGSLTLADTADINGTLSFNTTGGTAALDGTNRTVNYAGAALDLTNADTFTTTGSTWIFDGTTSLTSAGKTFNNVTIGTNTASGSLTFSDTTDINGTLAFNTTGGTAALDGTNRTVNYAGAALDLTNADTFTTTGSTWIFDGTTALTSAGKTFNVVQVGSGSASGSLTTNDTTDINGNVSFGNGGATTLNIANDTVSLAGDINFTNLDTLTTTGSTVVLDGPTQTITGNASLNHLTLATAGSTKSFAGGSTMTVGGNFTAQGTTGNLITMQSSNAAAWNMSVAGTSLIDYASLAYANNTGASIAVTNSVDGGNNVGFTGFPVLGGGNQNNSNTTSLIQQGLEEILRMAQPGMISFQSDLLFEYFTNLEIFTEPTMPEENASESAGPLKPDSKVSSQPDQAIYFNWGVYEIQEGKALEAQGLYNTGNGYELI